MSTGCFSAGAGWAMRFARGLLREDRGFAAISKLRSSMFHFCTTLESSGIATGAALLKSLRQHTGSGFRVAVLCYDIAAEDAARRWGADVVRPEELRKKYGPLAPTESDRTVEEFRQTCRSWLLFDQLHQVPSSTWLVLSAPTMAFFGPVASLLEELGEASAGLSSRNYAGEWRALERAGRFDPALVAVRNDPLGRACAADWAERCAKACFTLPQGAGFGDQKHLDRWLERGAGVAQWRHPGINVAPWNLGGRALEMRESGMFIDGEPLRCFQFSGVRHLVAGLFDPGLARWGVPVSPPLRDGLFIPYLRALGSEEFVRDVDIAPPRRAGDPRTGAALLAALSGWTAAQRAQLAAERTMDVLQNGVRRETAERAARAESDGRLIHALETERDLQRRTLLELKGKLEKAYDDILKDVEIKKQLVLAIDALRADKDAQIANLAAELERLSAQVPSPAARADARAALEPYAQRIHRLVVLKFHPRLLPAILWLTAMGVQVEVLSSPAEYCAGPQGPLRFRAPDAWEWLGQLNSLFDEEGYRRANPDVAAAISSGDLASGWEHYQRFGQWEFRPTGAVGYCTGLAEFDAVAFDASDAAALVPLLAGRLQPQNRLLISGFTPPTDWLPPTTNRDYLLGDLIFCERPPHTWLGPRWPANGLAVHLPKIERAELYPEVPAQRAEWPKIAVVIASHNSAAQLEATIRSVLDQNYPKMELIVAEGGSADGALEIIRRYSSRLILINGGVNDGLRKASAPWLSWLEPGDRLAPGSLFLVGQLALLHRADMIAGRCARVRGGEDPPFEIHRTCLPLNRIAPLSLTDLLDLEGAWLKDCFFDQPEVFITRDLLARTGNLLREELGAARDYDFWIRAAKAGALAFGIPEILALRLVREAAFAPVCVNQLRQARAAHQ
ncbi:MAG: hypothetical protein C0518_02970 [Opitutus sp.]|nr:hypothetical protein [Opitutus sp.]